MSMLTLCLWIGIQVPEATAGVTVVGKDSARRTQVKVMPSTSPAFWSMLPGHVHMYPAAFKGGHLRVQWFTCVCVVLRSIVGSYTCSV